MQLFKIWFVLCTSSATFLLFTLDKYYTKEALYRETVEVHSFVCVQHWLLRTYSSFDLYFFTTRSLEGDYPSYNPQEPINIDHLSSFGMHAFSELHYSSEELKQLVSLNDECLLSLKTCRLLQSLHLLRHPCLIHHQHLKDASLSQGRRCKKRWRHRGKRGGRNIKARGKSRVSFESPNFL